MPMILPILLAAASVPTPPCAIGTWATKASGQTIFRLDIENSSTGTTAIWTRPDNFEFDGDTFSNVDGHVVRRAANVTYVEDGDLVLSFEDPRPKATPDILHVRCAQVGHISVTFAGPDFDPFDFVKASINEAQLEPWDAKKFYTRQILRPTNVEMTHIFDSDQADRQAEHVDWSVVGPADEKRKQRTQELLDAGALQSGDDFYHAAFIFQHGSNTGDYLKAHLLAMVATARGNAGAIWIGAATLDRYLRRIGRPQVLGTQFKVPKGGPATQEPYDRSLISDAVRKALRVPPVAEQERQRLEYTMQEARSRTPSPHRTLTSRCKRSHR